MTIYISNSHNYRDTTNGVFYTVCGLLVSSDVLIEGLYKEVSDMILKRKLYKKNSLYNTLESKILDSDKYAKEIKKYLLKGIINLETKIICISKEIDKTEFSENKMIKKYFPEMVLKIIGKWDFSNKVISINPLSTIEAENALRNAVKYKYNMELYFYEKNDKSGIKISNNICSVVRKKHCGIEYINDFYEILSAFEYFKDQQ